MTDVLIVGGGLAGGAAAVQLALAGREVVLLEREPGPHDKVCGEFLSREAGLYLSALGLDLLALGAQEIGKIRFAVGDREVTVALPFTALSLSRRVLDAALLDRAAAAGVDIRLGARVQGIENGGRARLQTGETVTADTIFLATGKHDVRGLNRPSGSQSDLVGFKLHWRLSAPQTEALFGHVELMLFPGGYAGLELIEGGRANLCLLVTRRRLTAVGQHWDAVLAAIRAQCPLLDRRLAGAEPCWDKPLAISAIPYGHIGREDDGIWRLGDQAAVIPSFSGDGMSIALHSARLAAGLLLSGGNAAQYRRQLAHDVGGSVRLATWVSLTSVHPLAQAMIRRMGYALPPSIGAIARATRVPSRALRRAGLEAT
jgi:flavin-dependent dehydrogenase